MTPGGPPSATDKVTVCRHCQYRIVKSDDGSCWLHVRTRSAVCPVTVAEPYDEPSGP